MGFPANILMNTPHIHRSGTFFFVVCQYLRSYLPMLPEIINLFLKAAADRLILSATLLHSDPS
jgi:hypothetical protein